MLKSIARFSLRLIGGLAVLVGLIVGLFALTLPAIRTWGATPEEVASAQPGDAILSSPLSNWTNAITIQAPPEQVWPWVAQLGDSRGGYYSYTFIENRIGALLGVEDYNITYVNANEIHPEWQNPQKHDLLIKMLLEVYDLQPGEWLLANSVNEAMGWSWLFRVYPHAGGQASRLVVRFRGAPATPEAEPNAMMGVMMDAGDFVMTNKMLKGIALRAEGGSEPAWIETLEIGLWFGALLPGLIAAVLYLFKKNWRPALAVAVAAVIAIFGLTFVQPALWLRFGIDAALVAATVWAARI